MLGETVDDAAGEATTSGAPAQPAVSRGPPIDRAARDGDGTAIHFPRGKWGTDLRLLVLRVEDAVARWVEDANGRGGP